MVFLVSARRCCVRASLIHEYSKEYAFTVGAAVRSDEIFGILLLLSVVVIVVLVVIVVDLETTAFDCLLEIELLLTVVIVVVVVIVIVLFGTLFGQARTGQALVLADLQ